MSPNFKETSDSMYRGEQGRQYHKTVHSSSENASNAIASRRGKIFQPFIGASDTVMEYGVGMGWNLRFLKCGKRIGYDLSEAGRTICEASGIEFTSTLAFPESSIDVIICSHVLEHVPDPMGTLETIWRLLVPSGLLLLNVPFEVSRNTRRYTPNDPNMHLFTWTPLTLGNLLTRSQFAIEHINLHRFGYEQRLVFLWRWGRPVYSLGVSLVQRILPCYEIRLVGKKNSNLLEG